MNEAFRPSVANMHGTSCTQLDAEPTLSKFSQMGFWMLSLWDTKRHSAPYKYLDWEIRGPQDCSPLLYGMHTKPETPQGLTSTFSRSHSVRCTSRWAKDLGRGSCFGAQSQLLVWLGAKYLCCASACLYMERHASAS